ncbi:MAG: DUF2142 domain-containing protein [Lachnospiraceae bacterium]|nr:DUF2142 domain-containing protein [Lachnospiraceae bacterium]
MERRIKRTRICVFILAAVSLLILDIKAFGRIANEKEESYWEQNSLISTVEVKKQTIKTRLQAIGASLTRIQLWTESSTMPEGTLSWQIEDTAGNLVQKKQTEELDELWEEENGCICLDTSQVKWEAGEQYDLILKFQLEEPLALMADANGIMNTQWYQINYKGLQTGILILLNLLAAGSMAAVWLHGINHKTFLWLLLATGMAAAVLLPPFSRDDEFRHFVRAYDLSCGGHLGYYDVPQEGAVGNVFADEEGKAQMVQIPKEMSEMRLLAHEGNYNQITYFAETNQSLCVPKLLLMFQREEEEGLQEVSQVATVEKGMESYWPQVIMVGLGRLLGVRSGLWYYLAVTGQALAISLMLWGCFRLVKGHKELFVLYGLIPAVTVFRASASPDGLMMGEIALCLAVILHLREEKVLLNSKKGVLLTVCYLILVWQILLMKLPYALFCLGFLLLLRKENFQFLPWEACKRNRWKIIAGAGILGAAGVIYFVGIRKGDLFFQVLYQFVPKEHALYIRFHFWTILIMFLHKGKDLLRETYDSLCGNHMIPYGLFVGTVLLFSQKKCKVIIRGFLTFIFLGMLGMVVLVGYTFTPPDFGEVQGITYRYMLPVLPVLGLVLPSGNEKTQAYVEAVYPLLLVSMVFASCLAWAW